jgi:localization factor PodJL
VENVVMKAAIPWSVKGIEPTARELAKDAARRSGLTLGEWLNTVISEKADGGEQDLMPSGASRSSRPRDYVPAATFERATSKLEVIAEQLAKLTQRDREAAGGYGVYQPDARSADPRSEGSEHFSRILSRIETNERQSVDAFSAVNERLGTLGRQFAQAAKAATTFKPEEHPSFQALEKAVRNIVEHLESSEKRTRDSLKLMQDRVADMAGRAQAAPNDAVLRQAPAFSQLERRLNDLSQRVEVTEKVPVQSPAPELLRNELRELAKRIDTVRETAESLATRAQTQAVQTSQQELRAIEQRILGLLSETQQTFAKGTVTDAEMQRVRADVDALNKRIDQTRQNPAAERDVQTLKSAVEQLSTRVAQGPDLRPLADMDRRIAELAQRIHEQDAAPVAAFGELDQRITELDQKLDYAMQSLSAQASAQADQALSEQLAAVGERMDRAEQQLSHLSTIERAISQLYDGLEQTRNNAQQVAEDAATQAAQRMLSQMPAQVASVPQDMSALEDGLQTVREAAQQSDQRNQETLMALHETLEHIVSKLSELETATIGQRIAAAAAAPHIATHTGHAGSQFAESMQASPVAAPPVPFQGQAREPQRDQVVFTSDSIPASAYDFPELTSEPVVKAEPVVAPAAEQVEPKLEIDAPVQPAVVSPAAVEQGADDFIAAARRAAQAAQGGGTKIGVSGIGVRAKKKESGSLLGKLLGRGSGEAKKAPRTVADELARSRPIPSIADAPTAPTSAFRKPLLLVGVALIGLALALSYKMIPTVLKSTMPSKVSLLVEPFFQDDAPGVDAQKSDAAVPGTSAAAEAVSVEAPPETALVTPVPTSADEILTGSVAQPKEQLEAIVAGTVKDALPIPPETIGSSQLRADAAAGNPQAQFIIASRFMDGERVTRDFDQAALWYEKAAASGLAPAQYRMATLFERGRGVTRDMAKALEWYEKAAALGNVRSMHNAAVIAAGSDVGKADYAKALKWFSLAANHGLKDSQYNLAVLFERGLAGKPDLAEALFWYLAAARQNDEQAQKRADALVKAMPGDVVAAIKTKVKLWMPENAPEAANTVQVTETAWQDSAG